MTLCSIPNHKAQLSIDIIIYYFLHFEEVLERIDAIPRKHLSKEDLFHDLQRKCGMDRMESQVAYSIIKRAFRAFYHGSGEGGVPNPWLSKQLKHTSECMWAHAARRTAQVYAAYQGMFAISQKALEGKIKNLYRGLHDRMQAKPQPDENQECTCTTCAARIMRESLKPVRVTTQMHTISDPYEEMYRRVVDKILYDHENNEEHEEDQTHSKPKCTCPSTLQKDNNHHYYQEAAKLCNTGYGQGPFDCRWFSITKEEYEEDDKEPKVRLPEECPCPPCPEEGECSSCDSECDCNCEVCTCQTEGDFECEEGVAAEGEDDGFSNEKSLYSKIEDEISSEGSELKSDVEVTSNDVYSLQCMVKNPVKLQNNIRQIY